MKILAGYVDTDDFPGAENVEALSGVERKLYDLYKSIVVGAGEQSIRQVKMTLSDDEIQKFVDDFAITEDAFLVWLVHEVTPLLSSQGVQESPRRLDIFQSSAMELAASVLHLATNAQDVIDQAYSAGLADLYAKQKDERPELQGFIESLSTAGNMERLEADALEDVFELYDYACSKGILDSKETIEKTAQFAGLSA